MKSRSLIIVLVLGLVAIAVGWVYESRIGDAIGTAELEIPDNIDYFLTGLRYRSMNDDGQTDFEFTSPRLEHRPITDVSHIETPSLQIFRERARWQIDSQRAAYEHRSNLLHLEQQVVMQKLGDQPLRLLAERVSFYPDADRVTADAGIVLLSGGSRIEAEGAEFDLSTNVYSLERARAVYRDEPS